MIRLSIQQLSDAEISRWIAEKLPYSKSAWQYGSDHRLEPSDFVNDPAMVLMLLEKLRRDDNLVALTCAGWEDGEWHTWMVETNFVEVENANLGRAVAQAFMLAHGWSPE